MPDVLDPRPSFELTGRVVVVTGATGGLGGAIAEGLGACGARLVLTGRSAAAVDALADRVRADGGTAVGVAADITSPGDRTGIIEAAVDSFGGVDVLVNNAGTAHRVPATDVTPESWDRVFAVNTHAAFFLAQAAYPHLRANGRGSVVNVLSTGLWSGGAGSVLYRSSKAALHAVTMVLAQEWAPEGVRVNAVAPGAMDAGMGVALDGDRVARHVERTPQRRLGRAGELVPAVLYLASDASSFVTGTTLRVDGGAISL